MTGRRWSTFSAAAILAVTAGWLVRGGGTADGHSATESTLQDRLPSESTGRTIWYSEKGDLMVRLPERAYLSSWSTKDRVFGEPTLLAGDIYAIPRQSTSRLDAGGFRVSLYGVDALGRVDDVLVVSRYRGSDNRLLGFQWMMSRRGVEFVWPAMNEGECVVNKDGEKVASARNYYRDPQAVREATKYVIECEEPVTVRYQGKDYQTTDPRTYVVLMSRWDDGGIGTKIGEIDPGPGGGLKVGA